jgi:hypothetical protein
MQRQGQRLRADEAFLPGERIYALCYRRVNFSFSPLGDRAAMARLQKDNSWILSSKFRGDDDDENDEGLEVELGESDEAGEEGFEMTKMGDFVLTNRGRDGGVMTRIGA